MTPTATHHPASRATPSLGWFVSLSLLIHLGLLWGLLSQRQLLIGGSEQAPSTKLALRLQPPPHEPTRTQALSAADSLFPEKTDSPHAAKIPPESRQHLLAVKEPATRPVPTTIRAAAAADSSTLQESKRQDSATTNATDNTDSALQERLRITLQQALAEHFTYPLLARRRGWQGKVVLSFRLEADGRILDARIARSSGYGVLDHAALSALGKVKRLQRGLSRGLTLHLPVIYRLES